MAILLLDNYDSFTFNLYHLLEKVSDEKIVVYKNNQISIEEAYNAFDRYVLSPGPGLPSEAGIMPALIRAVAGKKPVLGVCLGLQAIAENYGGTLLNLKEVSHGIAGETLVTSNDLLFRGCRSRFKTGRYHSWVANEQSLPPELIVTARDDRGYVMALAHRYHHVRGVQFHPESILSEYGELMLSNWINS